MNGNAKSKKSKKKLELIKNLNHTRDYMKDFYIYGFKTRNDFSTKSKRTYDYEKKRIESWLGDLISFTNTSRGRQVSISTNCGSININPLYKAYQSKSFTDNDIKLHFYILDILQSQDKLSLNEISNRISYYFPLDEQIIRRKLNEYTKEGILICEKIGKANVYSISPKLDFISNENFKNALKFFSMIYPFGVVGYYLLNQLEIENDIFLIKHNYIVHTLEDIILLPLIQAINSKKLVEIETFDRNKQKKSIKGVIPLRISVSTQTGRRYLIFYNINDKKFKSFRLDFILSIKIMDTISNYNDYSKTLEEYSKYCWGISFGDFKNNYKVETIKFILKIELPKEKFILNRLLRECRNSKVEKISKDLYSCTIQTFDTNETKNWIRSFTGRIVSLESSNDTTTADFYDDIQKMYEIYGG